MHHDQSEFILGANLQGADLRGADLHEAFLLDANLQGAFLNGANMRGAMLDHTDLQGADLRGADPRGVQEVTIDQITSAKNWEQAICDDAPRAQLSLAPHPTQTVPADPAHITPH